MNEYISHIFMHIFILLNFFLCFALRPGLNRFGVRAGPEFSLCGCRVVAYVVCVIKNAALRLYTDFDKSFSSNRYFCFGLKMDFEQQRKSHICEYIIFSTLTRTHTLTFSEFLMNLFGFAQAGSLNANKIKCGRVAII